MHIKRIRWPAIGYRNAPNESNRGKRLNCAFQTNRLKRRGSPLHLNQIVSRQNINLLNTKQTMSYSFTTISLGSLFHTSYKLNILSFNLQFCCKYHRIGNRCIRHCYNFTSVLLSAFTLFTQKLRSNCLIFEIPDSCQVDILSSLKNHRPE